MNLVRGGTSSSPASLFAASEPGVWYDPSDLTTLFQDNAGTTPVTAPGQTVGLMLDKSQGLVLGPELVTNGTFDTGITGWTKVTGTTDPISWDSVGKRIKVTNDLVYYAGGTQTLSGLVVGTSYIITATISENTVDARIQISGLTGATSPSFPPGGGNARFVFTATSTSHIIVIQNNQNTLGGISYFDNISVKLLAGNHATQATSAQRPTYGVNPITGTRNLYTYTEQFDNAIWGKTSGPVTVAADVIVAPNGTITADKVQETTATADFFAISANPSPVLFSSSYTWSCYIKAAERSFVAVNFSAIGVTGAFNLTTGATQVNSGPMTLSTVDVGNGWWRCIATFSTPASGTNLLYHIISPALSLSVGVTVGTAGYGFYIWGAQIEQSATATAYQKVVSQYEVTQAGVQSVGYLRFDGVDDGMVTPTITPGIDNVQVFAGVRKLSDAARGILVELGPPTATGTFRVEAPNAAAPTYAFTSTGTIAVGIGPSTFPSPDTAVLTAQGGISTDTAILRRNGAQVSQSSADQGTGNYSGAAIYIGRRNGTDLPFNGRLYSLITRFGPNLTDGQIASTESWVNSRTGAY